jgi:adenylate kinase family enzyme
MTRISVRGISGSGKTTLAAELARRLDAPHVELDALYWGPGWTGASADELRAKVDPLLARPSWVVDGNYATSLGTLVTGRADLVVWLDLPLRVCLFRALRRTLARLADGQELWNGNRQTWRAAFWTRDSLLLYSVRAHRNLPGTIAATVPAQKLVRLRSSAEATDFAEQLVDRNGSR